MKNRNHKITYILASFLAFLLVLGTCPEGIAKISAEVKAGSPALPGEKSGEVLSYEEYYQLHQSAGFPQNEYLLDSTNLTVKSAECTIQDETSTDSKPISIPSKQYAEWTFQAASEGLYRIEIQYLSAGKTQYESECSVLVNHSLPFQESTGMKLDKVWADDGAIRKDNRGNDIMPDQSVREVWNTKILNGSENITSDYYYFYFEKGSNTFRFTSEKDTLEIGRIAIFNSAKIPSYHEYQAKTKNLQSNALSFRKKLEAENCLYKSSSNLYPMSDHSSSDVSPNDPVKIVLNYIGGGSWKNPGQWISWKITVPEDGFYNLGMKYKQNFVRGLQVRRQLTIDGEILFDEMKNLKFPYSTSWEFYQFGEEIKEATPYRIYLKRGEHEMKMEVVLGDMTEVLSGISHSLVTLNRIYQRIIMITGVTPDPYNDYFLHKEIPEMIPEFTKVIESLTRNAQYLEAQAGTNGTEAAGIYEVVRQLQSFLEKPNTIPQRLDSYKANLSTLAELLLSLKNQPLQLDYISITSSDQTPVIEKSGWIQNLVFRANSFFASFFEDYSTLGNQYQNIEEQKPLSVWISSNDLLSTGVSSGRDQATVLKRFIDEKFTVSTGIRVNLNLVSTSDTLLQAVVGGKAPDAAIFVPKTMPLTLAMRGALDDLSKAPRFSDWKSRVYDSAFIPYRYNDGVYGMPETQVFNVIYYRKDIFRDLGITLPDTWEEFYKVASVIQGKNLQVGVSADQSTLEMLLLQNDSSIYNADLSEIALTTPSAIKVFKEWTDLYSQYGVPIQYDFFNRFRTGEMPMAIASLTLYNQLSVAAPEINNEWEIAPIPATIKNGVANRSQSCTTTASIVLQSSPNKQEAYQFIDWWTSDEIQSLFGNSMENLMGAAARYNTANKNAFESLPWSDSEKEVILTLWKDVKDIPQSPASYYVSRNIMNAFRKVVYYNQNPREVITQYAQDMNKELTRKRREFVLE